MTLSAVVELLFMVDEMVKLVGVLLGVVEEEVVVDVALAPREALSATGHTEDKRQ